MADNALKTPLSVSLDQASRQRANDADQLFGKSLPCHVVAITGQIVTISFDIKSPYTIPQIQIPIATSVYDWIGVQVGDKGVAVPTDAYLGGVSGLGGGTADLSRRTNLATHKFHPVANINWEPPGSGDPNDRILNPKKGTLLLGNKDGTVKTKLYVDDDGHVIITGDLRVSGAIIAGYGGDDQVGLQTHTHEQDPDSNSDTEQDTHAPTAGT